MGPIRSRQGRLTYAEWYKAVDKAVGRKVGLSVDDLADCCYRDWYEDGMTPGQAAKLALENEGFEDY